MKEERSFFVNSFLVEKVFLLMISTAPNVHRSAKHDGVKLIRLTKSTLNCFWIPEVEQNVDGIFLGPRGGGRGGVDEMKQRWFSGGARATMTTDDAAWIGESTPAFDRAMRRNVWEEERVGDYREESGISLLCNLAGRHISIFPRVTFTRI